MSRQQPTNGAYGLGFSTVVSKTANYLIAASDVGTVFKFNGSGLTATLPATAPSMVWGICIINTNASALTVDPNGRTVNGSSSTFTIGQNGGIIIWTDGTNYVSPESGASSSPSGAAGGDLSGTYPNPTVAKVNGASVPASAGIVGTNASSQFVDDTANVQNSVYDYQATDTGSANAYAVALSPAVAAYVAGLFLKFKAANTNTTTSTLAVNGLTAKTIKKLDGTTNLVAGDITAGQIVCLIYDGTNFQLVSEMGTAESTSHKDAASGYAGLDSNTMLKTTEMQTAVVAVAASSYNVLDASRAKTHTFSDVSPVADIAVSLPQAGASSLFIAGWYAYFQSLSAANVVTITPTTSTINDGTGATTALKLGPGQSVMIVSDGTNYVALFLSLPGNATDAQILTWVTADKRWEPKGISALGGANASQLRGNNISSATPLNQDVLKWSNADNQYDLVLADGMEHGDAVWLADTAYWWIYEDFIANCNAATIFSSTPVVSPLGQYDWCVFGSTGGAGIPRVAAGAPPHAGLIQWGNVATSNGYAGLMLNAIINTGTPWLHPKSWALLENPGWKARWVWKWSGDLGSSSNSAFSFSKKSFYAGLSGAAILATKPASTNSWTSASTRPDHFIGVRYDTSTVPGAWGIASVAAGNGTVTVYTMSTSNGFNGGTDTFKNCTVTVRGCANANNNGNFTCTTSSSTTMTLNNTATSNAEATANVNASINILKINITAVTANSPVSGKATFTYVNLNSITSPGANGGFIGLQFTGSGFANGGNNVTGTCVGSTATTIILNVAGVTETVTANAGFLTPNYNGPDTHFMLEVVDNQTYSTTTPARHDAQGTTFDTGITPVENNWYRLEIDCTTAGQVVITLYDENNATSATHTFTVSQLSLAMGSTSWSTNANKVAFAIQAADAPSANSNVPVNQIFPLASGSSVTISGFTSTLAVLNGTWTLEDYNDGQGSVGSVRIWFFSNNASVGATSQASTWAFYPALTPILVWGDDTTGACNNTTTYPGPTHILVDSFHLAWNKAIASPSTVPTLTKSRYW